MSYVTPNTELYILANVPLSIKNAHSIDFQTKEDQEAYFMSKTKYMFSDATYQREKVGFVRVERNAEDLYDCNYMMFRNTSFGTKWFYAFIINCTYISNNVTMVSYAIDELQTWLLDYTYKPCHIKRTHTRLDTFGASLTAEPFNIDDYVYGSYKLIDVNTKDLAVIIGISDTGSAQVDGNLYDQLYSGLTLYGFLMTDVTGINTFLAQYKQTPDTVVVMYAVPKILLDVIPGMTYGQQIPQIVQGYSATVNIDPLSLSDDIDGYTPKNKKLYTYPYNFLRIDNGSQQTLTLRYELFDTPLESIQGAIDGTFVNPPELIFTPVRYKGTTAIPENEDTLTMNGYPLLSWNNNTFKTWLSTNWLTIGKQIAHTTLNLAQGFYNLKVNQGRTITSFFDSYMWSDYMNDDRIGFRNTVFNKALEGIATATNNVMDMARDAMGYLDTADMIYHASKQADELRGDIVSGNSLIAVGRKQYHQARMCIRHEQAEIIDNFFTMFGYSIEKIDTPNRRNRPHWTYIQTNNCTIVGNLPSDAKAYIEKVHNTGITWWTNGDEISDYTLDNSPTG